MTNHTETTNKHIMICGKRHVGKTTLIKKLLAEGDYNLGGFFTKSIVVDDSGFHQIYIHPASQPEDKRVYLDSNKIGSCNTKIHNVNSDVFDEEGVRLLSDISSCNLIIMDELGFMEKDSPQFMARVLELLEGDITVLGCIKNRTDIPFLNEIRKCSKVKVFDIDEDNRDDLFIEIRDMLTKMVDA
ncbi:MAG: nucleoside-triphosphatase [Bacillota bacterium]|nr:nucleoside-triphosphatase [Bacillota bacterium]